MPTIAATINDSQRSPTIANDYTHRNTAITMLRAIRDNTEHMIPPMIEMTSL